MTRLLTLLAGCLLLPSSVHAKDLRGRFGAGFNQQFGHVSAFSVRYALPTNSHAVNIQLEGNFGLDTATDADGRSVFSGGRVLYGFVAEDNMTLFAAGGVGILTESEANTVRIQPAMGADFFLFGLDNLGFTVEWGLNLDTGGSPSLETAAAMGAGVHYSF